MNLWEPECVVKVAKVTMPNYKLSEINQYGSVSDIMLLCEDHKCKNSTGLTILHFYPPHDHLDGSFGVFEEPINVFVIQLC
jgi:hypothetical protein